MRISDWSSDVCSSDLDPRSVVRRAAQPEFLREARRIHSGVVRGLVDRGRVHVDENELLVILEIRDRGEAEVIPAIPLDTIVDSGGLDFVLVVKREVKSDERRGGQSGVSPGKLG